jgi:predicted acetyltransferase
VGAGTIHVVDAATFRREAPGVFERVRLARPGMIGRDQLDWDMRADLRRWPETTKPWTGFRLLCTDADGTAQGYARYTVDDTWRDKRPRVTVKVAEMAAATPQAEARMWSYLAQMDWVQTVKAEDRPVDDVLPWLLADGRHAKLAGCFDFLWLRPLDVGRLLSTRTYETSGRVVVEVTDAQGLSNGRFVLDATPAGATCTPTAETAELTLPVATLGAACLGDVRLDVLQRAGWLDEHAAGAVARAGRLLTGAVAPWCNTWF